ncbi:MAG: hypothetical protein LBD28_01045 [Tannerellaceae bacterium]|nr:hypothetical protein [Tannerellaceae bacterium]
MSKAPRRKIGLTDKCRKLSSIESAPPTNVDSYLPANRAHRQMSRATCRRVGITNKC